MNKIFLIIGESGSGKDTAVNGLCAKYGYSRVKSYTTRPSRNTASDIKSHIFVSDEEFDELTDLVAYTVFDEHRYCATSQQVDESDLYIIDPDGVNYMLEHYKGKRAIVVIKIDTSPADRFLWLRERYGNNSSATVQALHRINHDKTAFGIEHMCRIDYLVYNGADKTPDELIEELHNIILQENCDGDSNQETD